MPPAQPDRPTQSLSPRRPSRAWRWPWAVAFLAVAYVGAYRAVRWRGDLRLGCDAQVMDEEGVVDLIFHGGTGQTWRTRLFRPCIAIEDWWIRRRLELISEALEQGR